MKAVQEKNILIGGGYSNSNPGDYLILKSTIYAFESLQKGNHYYIWTTNKDFKVSFKQGISYELVYWNPMVWTGNPGLFKKVVSKLYLLFFPILRPFFRSYYCNRDIKSVVERSDLVLFIGGGYINCFYGLPMFDLFLSMAAEKKPFFLLGQTIGPFLKGRYRRVAEGVFRRAKKIILRESYSRGELKEYVEKVIVSCDDVLGFYEKLTPMEKRKADSYFKASSKTVFIGLNLRTWSGTKKYFPELARELARFLEVYNKHKIRILFVPMEEGKDSSDYQGFAEFCQYLPDPNIITPLEPGFSPELKHYLIGKLDLFVGMRLHGVIFALDHAVPAVGLYGDEYYFSKMSGTLKLFDMESYAIDMGQLDNLYKKMTELLVNKTKISKLLAVRKKEIVRTRTLAFKSILGGEL